MAKYYQRLWKEVTIIGGGDNAFRILVEILLDKEGRSFVSNLAREDAELCIELLDRVSPSPCFCSSLSPSQMVSSGPRKVQPQNHRETGFLCHFEETCWNTWTTAKIHDDNKEN